MEGKREEERWNENRPSPIYIWIMENRIEVSHTKHTDTRTQLFVCTLFIQSHPLYATQQYEFDVKTQVGKTETVALFSLYTENRIKTFFSLASYHAQHTCTLATRTQLVSIEIKKTEMVQAARLFPLLSSSSSTSICVSFFPMHYFI